MSIGPGVTPSFNKLLRVAFSCLIRAAHGDGEWISLSLEGSVVSLIGMVGH
jgi:hypothetical protein